jgi:hypothetical protein
MKWRKSKILYLSLISVSLFLFSCEKVGIEPEKVGTVSFTNDIIPIFSNKCISCHNGGLNPDLRADTAYYSLKTGNYYNLATPADSKIVTQLKSISHGDRGTSQFEQNEILQWIVQGAKRN